MASSGDEYAYFASSTKITISSVITRDIMEHKLKIKEITINPLPSNEPVFIKNTNCNNDCGADSNAASHCLFVYVMNGEWRKKLLRHREKD